MSVSIEVRGVTLDYQIYSVRARSLKNAMFNMAVGGKFFRNSSDTVVVRALENVSFSLQEGDRLALYGHNGSGKSSMLRVLAGIYPPSRGNVFVEGELNSMIDLGYGLDMEATGIENIRQFALVRGCSRQRTAELIPKVIEFAELGQYIQLPIRTYSAGMLARLMFSMATELDVEILVLDEWLSAGDASFVKKAQDRMRSVVDSAKIVVLASHSWSLISDVCNKICVLEAGRVVYFGPIEGYKR